MVFLWFLARADYRTKSDRDFLFGRRFARDARRLRASPDSPSMVGVRIEGIREMLLRPRLRFVAIVAIVAGAAACAGSVTTAGGLVLSVASTEFREYVEQVFRRQNEVATELAFALDERNGASDAAELAAAEERLLSECASLNRLATARRDRERLPLTARTAAARTAPLCETATAAAVALLERDAR
jgi:hypothetical protein